MTPQNVEENLALYERDPDAWQHEADKMGNGWMRFQLLMNGLLVFPETSPSPQSSSMPEPVLES
jgi:hypothetical protein